MKIRTIKILQESQELHSVWAEVDGTMHFGTLTPETFAAEAGACRQLLELYTALTAQIQDVRTRLGEANKNISKANTRVYQGMRASYGSKSPEYVRVQKTRIYKSSSRRGTTTPPTPQTAMA